MNINVCIGLVIFVDSIEHVGSEKIGVPRNFLSINFHFPPRNFFERNKHLIWNDFQFATIRDPKKMELILIIKSLFIRLIELDSTIDNNNIFFWEYDCIIAFSICRVLDSNIIVNYWSRSVRGQKTIA